MEGSFPCALGALAKRVRIGSVEGMPEGGIFGMVESGIRMPEGGAFYLVEFESPALARARIMAYADKYGRVFATDSVLEAPPARYPDLHARVIEGTDRTRGVLVSTARDGAETEVGAYACKNPGRDGRYRIERACAHGTLPQGWLRYDEFIATAYFACVAFACARPPAAPFDAAAVFRRLDTPDLFEAVDAVALEAEAGGAAASGEAIGIERYLVRMLREAGVVGAGPHDLAAALPGGFEAQPVVRLLRTANYADTYYVDFYFADAEGSVVENGMFSTTPETAGARVRLLRAEAALNRLLLLSEHFEHAGEDAAAADEGYCDAMDAWLCDSICAQAADPAQAAPVESRWDKHLALARSLESLRLPYRVGYEFCSDAAARVFGVELLCPSGDVLPETRWSERDACCRECTRAERVGAAARYAAHAAILAAAQAFSVSSDIERVFVNCRFDPGSPDAAVAGVFERRAFAAAFAADGERAFPDPFAFLEACSISFAFGEGCALLPVAPCFVRGQGVFADGREPLIHRDDEPFSEAARELAGVRAPSGLTIFEGGDRALFADEVSAALDGGVPAAVACLKKIHDRTESVLVRGICRGLSRGFEAGELDEHSYLEVKEAFLDAYGFKPLMARASALMRADDQSRAIGVLEELLAKVETTPGFSDTSLTCYRFFDSYETRFLYARLCADDAAGRRVLPLPDEAFLVHDALAQAYVTSIAGADIALAHAERCIEMAPARAYSYLRAARAHFMRGEYRLEADLCAKALAVAWHPGDAGLALYWAAYAFWKLERFDAAAACYRRCIALRAPMADAAAVELDDLLGAVKGLQRRTEAEEDEILRAEGFPVGALKRNCESMLAMAKASVDSGCASLGCVLAASAMRVVRDDALMPLVKSLSAGK